jgi:hypothetical protein
MKLTHYQSEVISIHGARASFIASTTRVAGPSTAKKSNMA